MTQTELNKLQVILNAKHVELAGTLGRREGIAIGRTPDSLDETRLAAERDMMTRALERESKALREVRAAADRMATGTYGICLHCEEEISQKRLNAVPSAALCIACQTWADRNPGAQTAAEHSLLAMAA